MIDLAGASDVNRILAGGKPADLPMLRLPTKSNPDVNLKTPR
jgi:hypothetical protein